MSRLSAEERGEVNRLLEIIRNRSTVDRNADFARLGELFFKSDAFDPLPQEPPETVFSLEIYKKVWGEATELRKSGKLLEMGREIIAPRWWRFTAITIPIPPKGWKSPSPDSQGFSLYTAGKVWA